jgi:hypothetical protein
MWCEEISKTRQVSDFNFFLGAKNVMSQINCHRLPTADLQYSGRQIIKFASNAFAQHLAEFKRVARITPSEEGRPQAFLITASSSH